MTNEQIQLILEIISTFAIVAASIVAIYGINAWRKEFQGKRKIELAEEVLALFYEARGAISFIRSPFPLRDDGSRKAEENETKRQKEAEDLCYVVHERFQKQQHVFNKLQSKQYQFMARFGDEKAKPFDVLRQIVLEILMSANDLLPIMIQRERNVQNEEFSEEERRLRAIIREYQTVADPIRPRVEKVILDIEVICKPIILGRKVK